MRVRVTVGAALPDTVRFRDPSGMFDYPMPVSGAVQDQSDPLVWELTTPNAMMPWVPLCEILISAVNSQSGVASQEMSGRVT